MSSILDAVTRDGSRSGAIPGAASPAPAPPPGDRGRWKPAILVVVIGVLAGAAAARLFGGGEPPVEDLRTERTVASPAASAVARTDPAAAPKVHADAPPGVPPSAPPREETPAHGKTARPAARKKDETPETPAPAVPALPAAVPGAPIPVASDPPAAPAPTAEVEAPPAKPPAQEPAPPATTPEEASPSGADGSVDDDVSTEAPPGAPSVTILFVAWSRTPGERLASMRVGTGSLSVVHEGEYVEGLQVAAIHPESVDFRWTGEKFRVPVREF